MASSLHHIHDSTMRPQKSCGYVYNTPDLDGQKALAEGSYSSRHYVTRVLSDHATTTARTVVVARRTSSSG